MLRHLAILASNNTNTSSYHWWLVEAMKKDKVHCPPLMVYCTGTTVGVRSQSNLKQCVRPESNEKVTHKAKSHRQHKNKNESCKDKIDYDLLCLFQNRE